MTAEVLGILHAVVSSYQHPDTIPNILKEEILELPEMKFLAGEPSLVFVCLEILLFIDERHDIDKFISQYQSLNDMQLRYCLLSGQHKIESLSSINEDELILLASELNINDRDAYKKYLKEPKSFYDPIMKLAEVVFNHQTFKDIFTVDVKEKIRSHYSKLDDELLKRHPLSYAQSIMGKSFYNISDWERYEFLYLYTIYPYKARLMDDHQNIMLISVIDRQWDDEDHLKKIQKQMKLIADPTRMSILKMIYSNPMYGKELAEKLSLTTATVSHHLDQMNKEGLIHVERDKNTKYYSSNQRSLSTLMREINKYLTNL